MDRNSLTARTVENVPTQPPESPCSGRAGYEPALTDRRRAAVTSAAGIRQGRKAQDSNEKGRSGRFLLTVLETVRWPEPASSHDMVWSTALTHSTPPAAASVGRRARPSSVTVAAALQLLIAAGYLIGPTLGLLY